jgi:putative oxidoreductase
MFDRIAKFDPLPRTRMERKAELAALFLRLALAVIFLYHGLDKIMGRDHDWGAAWATKMWLNNPDVQRVGPDGDPVTPGEMFPAVQLLVAWAEALGGAALAVGLFSRIAAVAMIIVQAGAIWLVTFARGFAGVGGYEYNVALIVMCLAVLILGDGALAVDKLIAPPDQARAEETKAEPLKPVA